MEWTPTLSVILTTLLYCLQNTFAKQSHVDMVRNCGHSLYSDLDDNDVAYVNIDGSEWWNGLSCSLVFKADDSFDDLQLTFTHYNMDDCQVSFEVWTSITSNFVGTTESTYSCHNAPLTNWRYSKNRYLKLKLRRNRESLRDFKIKLKIEVQDYSSSISKASSIGLAFSTVIGIVVTVIVLVVVIIVVTVCCCCMKSRRSAGTVYRQNYQAAPVATNNSQPQNWQQQQHHPTQGAQPSAPYPTLPGYSQHPQSMPAPAGGNYPYGYGYPQQSGPMPPSYPPAGGYPTETAGYQHSPNPGANIQPSAPPPADDPPPPYPGFESAPLKGY